MMPIAAKTRVAACAALILSLAGCANLNQQGAGGKPSLTLAPVAFSALPGWRDDHLAEALPAFALGCQQLALSPPDQTLGGSGTAATLGGQAGLWTSVCAAARAVPPGDEAAARAFFEGHLQAYAVGNNGQTQGLFTGYYEPQIDGSRSRSGRYQTALLSRPVDLVQADLGTFADDLKGRRISGRVENGALVPYYSRAEIEGGALARRRLDLLYVADPIDAFVLQIQGSGRIQLPNGRVARVTYDGQNGRTYVAIGKVLSDRGDIPPDQVSMQSIRAWLNAHPDQAAQMMDQNPSFVFFREISNIPADEGPPGAMGVPLTPERSIAVDRGFLPLGAPVWIDTTDPVTKQPLRRLMIAQDLGGAIKGPVRADVFWGWGSDAENKAGLMRQQGTDYVLLPKPTS